VVAHAGDGGFRGVNIHGVRIGAVHDHGHKHAAAGGDVGHLVDAGVDGHIVVVVHYEDGGAVGTGVVAAAVVHAGAAGLGDRSAVGAEEITAIGGLVHFSQLIVAVVLLVVQEPLVNISVSQALPRLLIIVVDGDDRVGSVHKV